MNYSITRDKLGYVNEEEPDSNYYGYWGGLGDTNGYGYRGLYYIGYNLTGIPQDAIISRVLMNVWHDSNSQPGCSLEFCFVNDNSWIPYTITYNNKPSAGVCVGSVGIPSAQGEVYANLDQLVPIIDGLRPNGYISLKADYYGFNTGFAFRDLIIVHNHGLINIASVQGNINKKAINVKTAVSQGAINKNVNSMKIAPVQGSINKTVF